MVIVRAFHPHPSLPRRGGRELRKFLDLTVCAGVGSALRE